MRRMVAVGVVAGILPLALISAYDSAFGPFRDDSIYSWQILVGPLLIAAACAPWVGPRGAAIIVLVGVPIAALATLILGLALVLVIPG